MVRAVDRALDILECLAKTQQVLGISELARKVDLPKATAFRIVRSLEQRHYLVQDEQQRYRLGPAVLRLGKAFLADLDYRLVARPYMKKIRDEINESVSLYIIFGNKRLCVERIESTQGLRRVIDVGDTLPLVGASGKVLLAFGAKSKEAVDQAECETIRQNGYAVSHGEREEGVSAVAAPLKNHDGKVVAALAISGPSFRYQGELLTKYIAVVTAAARAISRQLGYGGDA